jgi:hypothetical protein
MFLEGSEDKDTKQRDKVDKSQQFALEEGYVDALSGRSNWPDGSPLEYSVILTDLS